jgi:hypothetical protein
MLSTQLSCSEKLAPIHLLLPSACCWLGSPVTCRVASTVKQSQPGWAGTSPARTRCWWAGGEGQTRTTAPAQWQVSKMRGHNSTWTGRQTEDQCPHSQPGFIRMWLSASCLSAVLYQHRCTLQFHPESKHALKAFVVMANNPSLVRASACRLIGPTPGSCPLSMYGVAAFPDHAAVKLVSSIGRSADMWQDETTSIM